MRSVAGVAAASVGRSATAVAVVWVWSVVGLVAVMVVVSLRAVWVGAGAVGVWTGAGKPGPEMTLGSRCSRRSPPSVTVVPSRPDRAIAADSLLALARNRGSLPPRVVATALPLSCFDRGVSMAGTGLDFWGVRAAVRGRLRSFLR